MMALTRSQFQVFSPLDICSDETFKDIFAVMGISLDEMAKLEKI
jgi:hypothetical protein